MTRLVGLTVTALALAGIAGCATHGGLTSSAERLERSAYALQGDARDKPGTDYGRDAQEFADEARSFRRVIEDGSIDDADVQEAFGGLTRRYHALRDEVARSGDREAELDFEPVTQAYLDVEREMRERVGGDRYMSDDD